LVLKRLVVALLPSLFCFNMDGLGRSTFYIRQNKVSHRI